MSFRDVEFTRNRQVIHDLLLRAKRFHCSINATVELDVTDLLARIEAERAAGRDIGLVSFLVKATARLLELHPRLNHHLFTRWWGGRREVAFERIHCTLIVKRDGLGGEEILLPLVIRDANVKPVEEIHAIIRDHKRREVESLPQMKAMQKLKRLPRLALTWFSFKARSDPKFYSKYFGTYGLSSLIDEGGAGVAGATLANTASAFLPGTLKPRPAVVDGAIVSRTILSMGCVADHYVVDGMEALRAGTTLRQLVEDPAWLLDGPTTREES